MTPERARELLDRDPSRTALLFDFDGTLAPIVEDPAAAEPLSGTSDVLDELAERFRVVGVISGRPLDYLKGRLGSGIALSGLYGLESRIDGHVVVHPEHKRWAEVVDAVVARDSAPAGLNIESKGASLTVHFRGHDELAASAREWAAGVSQNTGLELREAKASFELHPPIDISKGTAVRSLVSGCDVVCFVGDDVGDLPAFDVLDSLADEGVATTKIACGGAELPPSVAAAADFVLAGPAEVASFFAALVA